MAVRTGFASETYNDGKRNVFATICVTESHLAGIKRIYYHNRLARYAYVATITRTILSHASLGTVETTPSCLCLYRRVSNHKLSHTSEVWVQILKNSMVTR